MDEELEVLLGVICDGLRQEARARWLTERSIKGTLAVSLTQAREQEIASSIYSQLRSVGFFTQVESYFKTADARLRPDFRIWLPVSEAYLYLELKLIAWGEGYSYYPQAALEDLAKLTVIPDVPNGLLAIGFSKRDESQHDALQATYDQLAKDIVNQHPAYKKVGLKRVELLKLDKKTSYAMVGLWVRRSK